MKLWSNSFADGDVLPGSLAFAVPDPENKISLSENRSPHLAWSELPEGTQSLVLICHDPDVPSSPEDVNKEGREVPADLPRVTFYHWVLVDLDPGLGELAEGAFSEAVTPRGKDGPDAPLGTRQGMNDYKGWFAGDADMEGDWFGYDGPCPPWNDSIIHHYHFTLYATDLKQVEVSGKFTAADVFAAIEGHILAKASIHGKYSLNPSVIG